MILRIELLDEHPLKNVNTSIKMNFRVDTDRAVDVSVFVTIVNKYIQKVAYVSCTNAPQLHIDALNIVPCIFVFLQNNTRLKCHYFNEKGRCRVCSQSNYEIRRTTQLRQLLLMY